MVQMCSHGQVYARLPRFNIYNGIKSIPKEQIYDKSEAGYFYKIQKKFELLSHLKNIKKNLICSFFVKR